MLPRSSATQRPQALISQKPQKKNLKSAGNRPENDLKSIKKHTKIDPRSPPEAISKPSRIFIGFSPHLAPIREPFWHPSGDLFAKKIDVKSMSKTTPNKYNDFYVLGWILGPSGGAKIEPRSSPSGFFEDRPSCLRERFWSMLAPFRPLLGPLFRIENHFENDFQKETEKTPKKTLMTNPPAPGPGAIPGPLSLRLPLLFTPPGYPHNVHR